MIRAHVIRLDPTCKQEEFFWRCVGTARFAFNWALQQWREQHAAGDKPNEGALRKQLNAIKGTEFPWMYEVPKTVVQQAIKNLGAAYKNFFASHGGKRSGRKMRAPDFKSKHRSRNSARLDDGPGTFSFNGKHIKLPKIGTVKTHEELRYDGKPLSATITHTGGHWWVSVQVELKDLSPAKLDASVGIDMGIHTALVTSDGLELVAPKPLASSLRRLKRIGRSVSRKEKGSNNRAKEAKKLCRLHWRVAQIRKDWQHKATTAIAKQYGLVCIEDLSVNGMMRNRMLARAIGDIGFYSIRRQLEYKANEVATVSRWYPSSKMCSCCGVTKDSLALSERTFKCEHCALEIDRDLNAAINIHTAGLAGIYAWGPEGSDVKTISDVKPCRVEPRTRPEAQLVVLTT